jgi:hypothetical protein
MLKNFHKIALHFLHFSEINKFDFENVTQTVTCNQWWASASRNPSAFWHPLSQSGTGPNNAGLRHFIPVPDWFHLY